MILVSMLGLVLVIAMLASKREEVSGWLTLILFVICIPVPIAVLAGMILYDILR